MANRKAYPQKSTKIPGTFNRNTKWRRRGTKYPSITLGKGLREKKVQLETSQMTELK
jgi:hypothetical protein